MRLPTITCAVCRRPVDELTCVEDFADRSWELTARCHGEVDVCVVRDHDLDGADAASLSRGTAFAGRRKLSTSGGES